MADPDSLLVQKPAAVSLCRELGIADRLVPTLTPRTAYVLRDGRLHAIAEGSFLGFPLKLTSLARSSLFTAKGKLRMACEVIIPRGRRERRVDRLHSCAAASAARRQTTLPKPLLAGIHAGDVDRLSVRALFPRLVDAERQSGSVIGRCVRSTCGRRRRARSSRCQAASASWQRHSPRH
jgi:oxygen-dependent protoporphyrinogen oxidase